MSQQDSIGKGDLVLTPTGHRATVLYLHRNAPKALVLYQDRKERATLSVDCLTKLPESERTDRSRAVRASWVTRRTQRPVLDTAALEAAFLKKSHG
jgi:hypothetical protein